MDSKKLVPSEMYSLLSKLFGVIALVITVIFLLNFCTLVYHNHKLLIYPDLFINYQAGFIRRGLDGQLLYSFSTIANLSFITIGQFYGLITFLCFIIVLSIGIVKLDIPLFIIFSMCTLLLYFSYIERGLRKDHILFTFAILQALFFSNANFYKKAIYRLLFVLGSIIATLMHEIFFLITIAPCLIGFRIISGRSITKFIKNSALLIPVGFAFLLVLFFRGDSTQAQAIIDSYGEIHYDIHFFYGVFSRTFYFWDINYNLKDVLLFFMMLGMMAAFLLISIYNQNISSSRKTIFAVLLPLQTLLMIVVCLVAVDYSRIISLFYSTSIFYIFSYHIPKGMKIRDLDLLDRISKRLRYLPFILFIIMTMPFNYWNGTKSIVECNIILLIQKTLEKP